MAKSVYQWKKKVATVEIDPWLGWTFSYFKKLSGYLLKRPELLQLCEGQDCIEYSSTLVTGKTPVEDFKFIVSS